MGHRFRNISCMALGYCLVASSLPVTVHGEAQNSIRVATVNLFHDFPTHRYITERLDIVADEIRTERIDVVGVQEVSLLFRRHRVFDRETGKPRHRWRLNALKYLARKLDYEYRYYSIERAGWFVGFRVGQGVLSRYPIVESEKLKFRTQKPLPVRILGKEGRGVLKAVIDSPEGRFAFLTTHLTHDPPEVNAAQAIETAEFVQTVRADYSVVLAGDLNAIPESESMQALGAITDAVNSSGYLRGDARHTWCEPVVVVETGLSETCPRDQRGNLIRAELDYVLVFPEPGEDIEIIRAGRMLNKGRQFPGVAQPIRASDHLGALAELRF